MNRVDQFLVLRYLTILPFSHILKIHWLDQLSITTSWNLMVGLTLSSSSSCGWFFVWLFQGLIMYVCLHTFDKGFVISYESYMYWCCFHVLSMTTLRAFFLFCPLLQYNLSISMWACVCMVKWAGPSSIREWLKLQLLFHLADGATQLSGIFVDKPEASIEGVAGEKRTLSFKTLLN